MAGASVTIETDDPESLTTGQDGVVVAFPDGSVVVETNPKPKSKANAKFSDNLAMDMASGELGTIATELLEGIDSDIESRKEWENTRAKGIDMLGLKPAAPRSDISSSAAPFEGMSSVRDSTLLDAVLRGQANAIGELLPADGPVKVKNVGQETGADDQLAETLEIDLNHYLTDVATEYYPDTKRLLFWTIFGGSGWKKVYNCPIRRRPVSESIDANDIIVANTATDLWNAGRITHRISMRKSVMKRMQFLGVYRDVTLTEPSMPSNAVDQKKEQVEGVKPSNTRPEDVNYTLYECYCELDLNEFAPPDYKGKGIPLPYRVTIDKDSRQVLEVHRNWRENDNACLPRKYFVRYPYVEGFGLYGIGLVHILGNSVQALTAAEREMLDAGMFANFPGFLIAKQATRQLTNELRIPPGGSAAIDIGEKKIGDVAMPLPYKDITPGLMSLFKFMKEDAQRLGGTADLPIGEGKQDAPVGTTIALIEQATKVESAVHKGMHHAQAEEFQLLKERFQEDPEAFWRHDPATKWTQDTFLAALNEMDLTPVADPNTPSHVHRLLKAMVLKQLQAMNPTLYDARAVDMRILGMMRFADAESLMVPAGQNPAPDPKVMVDSIVAQAKMLDAQTKQKKLSFDLENNSADIAARQEEIKSREAIATMNLAGDMVVHGDKQDHAKNQHMLDIVNSAHQASMDMRPDTPSKPKKSKKS